MGFSRQDYWSELPFPAPGDLPDPGIELTSLKSSALKEGPLPLAPPVLVSSEMLPNPFFSFTFSNRWAWDASWCNRGWPGGSCDTVVISCLCANLVIPVHVVGLQLSIMHDQFSCHVKCTRVQSLSCVWFYCDLMDCNPSGSSVPGISPARILEWVAISSSRGSSWGVLHCWWILYHYSTWEARHVKCLPPNYTLISSESKCYFVWKTEMKMAVGGVVSTPY